MNDQATRHAFVVGPQEGGRLDRYLAERPELAAAAISRTRVKSLIEAGHAELDTSSVFRLYDERLI